MAADLMDAEDPGSTGLYKHLIGRTIETPAGIVGSLVTTSSIERLDLRVGDEALALFKSTEVMIAKLDA